MQSIQNRFNRIEHTPLFRQYQNAQRASDRQPDGFGVSTGVSIVKKK